MNCSDFENIVADLARDHLKEALRRGEALAHMETCAECASLLAEERLLTAWLAELADDARQEGGAPREAAARLEDSLLSAFRQQAPASAGRAAIPTVDRGPALFKRRHPAWSFGNVSVAAVLFLTIGVWAWQSRRTKVQGGKIATESPVSSQARPSDRQSIAEIEAEEAGSRLQPAGRAGVDPPGNMRSSRHDEVAYGGDTASRARSAEAPVHDDEHATGFLPLVAGDDLSAQEGRHLVRIRVPRAAMGSFGLQYREDRATEAIDADVLIGEDGIARAIRFLL